MSCSLFLSSRVTTSGQVTLHTECCAVWSDGLAATVAVVLSTHSTNTMERQPTSPDFLSAHGGPHLIGRQQPARPLIGGERARVASVSDVTESSPGKTKLPW